MLVNSTTSNESTYGCSVIQTRTTNELPYNIASWLTIDRAILLATHHVLQSFIKLVPAATMLPSIAVQAINDGQVLLYYVAS